MRISALILAALLVPWAVHAQQSAEDPPALSATIAGRVCEDRNGDGLCSPDEPGIKNVRLVLATGSEVRTDEHGRYHLTGVDSRTPDATGGLHLRPGRHRLRVDPRTLPPYGQVNPKAATVEVSWAAVVLQDFAVRIPEAASSPVLPSAPSQAAPEAEVQGASVAFSVSGQASPGDTVQVEGAEAQVDAAGVYRASVLLHPGAQELHIVASSPAGRVRFFTQRIDVMRRKESWLIAPRAIQLLGSVQLPGRRGEAVPSGAALLRIEVPRETVATVGERTIRVGPEAPADLSVTLEPGRNAIDVKLSGVALKLEILAEARPFVVGLLDLEGAYSLGDGAFQLHGRGAAHGEVRLGALRLLGEVDLRDTDLRTLPHEEASAWLRPRLPERFERSLDPERAINEWGDDSVTLTPNAAQGRLRLSAEHDRYGRAGLGTYRALWDEGEIGRYHQPIFGPFLELQSKPGVGRYGDWWTDPAIAESAPPNPFRVGVNAFAGSLTDPVRGVSTRPAHEELRSTGGSLYFLGVSAIVEGSESLRVELRNSFTGAPLADQRLVRGQDYEIDYISGRILLARPLSFLTGSQWSPDLPATPQPSLAGDALISAPEQVLVADYAVAELAGSHDTVGGEAWAEWHDLRGVLSGARESRGTDTYQLLAGRGQGQLLGYRWEAEVARSSGLAIGSRGFGVSDDGGFSFLRPSLGLGTEGNAVGLRLHGDGPFRMPVDVSYRWRERGYSDSAHTESAFYRQFSLRAQKWVGPVELSLLGDDLRSADPREPFSSSSIAARTLGAGVEYWLRGGQGNLRDWRFRLSVRDAWLRASEVAGEGPVLEGGRISAELQASVLNLSPYVKLTAGHRQALALRGEGPGRVNDSFSWLGVDVPVGADSTLGLRGGWGPDLGPRVWANASVRRGPETYYGGYSVDVDGPDFGAGRAMMGARIDAGDRTSVFTEEVAVQNANEVRLGRAVGLQKTLFDGLEVGARYERGVRNPLELLSSLKRDSGGLFGQLVLERLRVSARAELRKESGVPVRGDPTPVDRLQAVVTLASEAALREDLSLSGRLNFARTVNTEKLEERLLEGSAGVAWRPGPFLLVARYSVTRELLPGTRAAFGDRALQTFSLLPAVRLGDRLAVAAGAHLGRSGLGGEGTWTGTFTLRPSVRVVGGLETAVEVARRTSAREGESLSSVRGEVGYRVDEGVRFAAGYTVLGFSGLGLSGETTDDSDRLYLRAEVAY
ncbi:flagellar motor protein [Hyalangium versicolor]|uniref:flagellar motor protein n=1 Tax=Hyalangium versicolor TaxID=2861190 RepID=UPI001CC9AC24|nr:flagellar motor protein [Hyalangium versicolor]